MYTHEHFIVNIEFGLSLSAVCIVLIIFLSTNPPQFCGYKNTPNIIFSEMTSNNNDTLCRYYV